MTYVQKPKSYFYPEITFNLTSGILDITGNSILIETSNYYEKSYDWLHDNLHYHEDLIILNLNFNMFCPSSSTEIRKILILLKNSIEKNKLVINWFYSKGETETKEIGEHIAEMVGLDINIIEKK